MDTFVDILLDTLLDTAKALPLLAAVYLLAGWLEHRAGTVRLLAKLPHQLDVVAGALAGCIPQCGFSAAAASLYQEGFIGGAALVAVFLSGLSLSSKKTDLCLQGKGYYSCSCKRRYFLFYRFQIRMFHL